MTRELHLPLLKSKLFCSWSVYLLESTVIQGDNFTARHGDFHLILTLVCMGTRPTKMYVMLKLGKALQSFHLRMETSFLAISYFPYMSQNRSIIYVNLLIITDLNRTLNNLYPLLDYYGMKTKSPGSNPTLNILLLLYILYNYYEIKIQCR